MDNAIHELLEKEVITTDEYVRILNSLSYESGENEIISDCEKIISIVAEYYKMDLKEIKSLSHSSINVNARHAALYLCRKYTSISVRTLCLLINHCDYSTVIYTERKIEDEIVSQDELAKDILKMEKRIETYLAEKNVMRCINNISH